MKAKEFLKRLPSSAVDQLNDSAGFLSFKRNFILWALIDCDAHTIYIETGNRAGKTASVTMYYLMRLMGKGLRHDWKYMKPNSPSRIIRLASEKLPMDSNAGEDVHNTIYPQLKAFMPGSWLKKDITMRNPIVSVRPPGHEKNVVFEFVSYNQEVQSQAGFQRFSIYLDEHSPKSFYEEQIPRLIGTDGDIIIGLTPSLLADWEFVDLHQKARIIYNSPTIKEYMKKSKGISLKTKQVTDSKLDIAVIRAATDDNPLLLKDEIEQRYAVYDDDMTIEIRRYGICSQISGVVFQDFDVEIHKISQEKYFHDGIPDDWVHARGIDFHEHVNWACSWVCLSLWNEVFVYDEFNPSPDRMVTLQIAREVATKNGDQSFVCNLIDPRAAIKQANTGLSPLDDMNRIFMQLKREGACSGGIWESWDTKNLIGRDEIRKRLKNSRLVGRPFNNRQINPRNGLEEFLPTMWILDNCPRTVFMFKNWRWKQYESLEARITKGEKNEPEDANSHFPVTVECIFKDMRFRVRKPYTETRRPLYQGSFNAGARY